MLVEHHLYMARVVFPADCVRPTIAVRTKDTMICPLATDGPDRLGYEWLWGVELAQAIRLGRAQVYIRERIQYKGDATHRDYVDYMFSER